MDPTSAGGQSAQPNWSELLSKASQGSSLFVKGEGKQVSDIAISPLGKTMGKDYKKYLYKRL